MVVAPKPRLTWRPFLIEEITVAGGATSIFNLGTVGPGPMLTALGVFGDFTIRRMRWTLGAIDADVESVADEITVLHWGMTIVSLDAFNSGGGALPDPRDDAADWFGYGTVMLAARTGGTGSPESMIPLTEDGRAMRKVNENSHVVALVFSTDVGRTVKLSAAGRMLVSHGRQ